MATQRLSAELQIDAGLGASFMRAFEKLDARVNASTRKLQDIGKGAFDKLDARRATRQLDKATQQMDSAFMRVFRNFKTRFVSATDTAFNYLKRKMGKAQVLDVGVRGTVLERGPPDGESALPPTAGAAAIGFAMSAFQRLPRVFKDTNVQLMEAQKNIRGLKRQGKNFEELARHARSMDKAVSPWLQKIDGVNRELAVQEKRIDHLRMARNRVNKAESQFNLGLHSRVAPLGRNVAFGALDAAATGGSALARGAEAYSNLDQGSRVLQTEGVAEHDIPLIREQVFRLTETTEFPIVEIANVLVGMKKDGQAVTAELTGVADILKLAVAESRSLEAAWDATRTLINTTGTDLAGAIKLQEQLSNATSVSALNMEQLQYIAGQSLSIYKGIAAFDSADFLTLSGALGGILRPERISTGLREFALTLADAAAGNLSDPRQEAFDLLNLNITDEEGKLKDAVSILKEFERSFNRPEFLDKEGQLIGGKVQPILAQTFDREALPTVANLLFKSEQIAKNIEAINTPGTLERKSSVMEQSIDAAVNRLKSAVSVLSQRFFEALDGDGNFNRIVDGMSAKVQGLSKWLTENRLKIESAFKSFVQGAGQIAYAGAKVFGQLFAYLRDRGPQIRAFFAALFKDVLGVWTTIKPVVMGVLAGLREMFEVVSRLTGGNTKLLAWLASAYVGWKALQTPILAVNAGYNSVLGTVHKLSAAYAGMRVPALSAPPIMQGAAPAPVVQTVTQKVTGTPVVFLGKIRPLLAKIGQLLAPILLKIAALGPAFAKVGTFIAPLITKIGTFVAPLLAKIAAIGPAILATLGAISAPVAAAIAAVVATVAGGVALVIANWDKAKAAFWSTVETIKLVGQVIWEGLQWVGRNIVQSFTVMLPNVQRVVSATGTHIGNVFKGVGDWLVQYLGPVGQFIVSVFKGVLDSVSWAAGQIWDVLKGVGGHIGTFFKSVFGGIVSGIMSAVRWLKQKVGEFFEWVTAMNEKVQGILHRIRDFFRKDKETAVVAKTELQAQEIDLDVAVPPIPRQSVAADVNWTRTFLSPIPGMETAQEFYLRAPDIPDMEETFSEKGLPELKTPAAPVMEMPQIPELTMPTAPELQTPAAPELGMPAAPELTMPQTPEKNMNEVHFFSPQLEPPLTEIRGPTAEATGDFKIDNTLKAGFKSLLHVNSAILQQLTGTEDTDWTKKSRAQHAPMQGEVFHFFHIDAPEIEAVSFDSPVVSVPQMQDITFGIPKPEPQDIGIDAPVVSVPEMDAVTFGSPIVEIPPREDIKIDTPNVEMPEMQDIRLKTPVVSAPQIADIQIDAPVVAVPEPQDIGTEVNRMKGNEMNESSFVLRPCGHLFYFIDAPVVSVPEMDAVTFGSPIVEIPPREDIKIDTPNVEMPEMQDITLEIDTPVVSIPEMQDIIIDAPVVAVPEPQDIGTEVNRMKGNEMNESSFVLRPCGHLFYFIDAPVVSVPEMDAVTFGSPIVEIPPREDIKIDTPNVEMPEMQDITLEIDTPVVSIPEMQDIIIDAPTVTIPSPVADNQTRFPADTTLPQERIPPALVPIQAPGRRENEMQSVPSAGNSEQNVEITNNITIHQQPGEDAEMLTARILRELERKHRTEAYQ